MARSHNHAMRLRATSSELILPGQRIGTRLVGADASAQIMGEAALPAKTHYFRGDSQTTATNFARVRSRAVYPGIDMLFHGRGGLLEYDFIAAPGADPDQIAFDIDGAQPRLNAAGDLMLTPDVRWKRPEVYQEIAGARRKVEARYVITGQRVRFALGAYDRKHELIVDPVLAFSTLAGKAGNEGLRGIALDGNAETAHSNLLPMTIIQNQ